MPRTSFESHSVKVEHGAVSEGSVVMMLVREQIVELADLVSTSRHVMHEVIELLYDPRLGVATNAADVFRLVAVRGVHIGEAIPSLEDTLKNSYAKRIAAEAMAHHFMNTGDVSGMGRLMNSEDLEVRKTALETCIGREAHAKG